MVRQLHQGDFIDGADDVVLIGGLGTGKTHIATALAMQAIEYRHRNATLDLVNALEQEEAMNRAGQLAERLHHEVPIRRHRLHHRYIKACKFRRNLFN